MMFQSGIFRSCARKAGASITEIIALWAVMQAAADEMQIQSCLLEVDILAATAGIDPEKAMRILVILDKAHLIDIDGERMIELLPQCNAQKRNETQAPSDETEVQ